MAYKMYEITDGKLDLSKMTDSKCKELWEYLTGTYLETASDGLDNEYRDCSGRFVPLDERAEYYQVLNDEYGELKFAMGALLRYNPRIALKAILKEYPNFNPMSRKDLVSEIANMVNEEHQNRV